MRIRNPAYRDQEEEEGGTSASDESRLLSLRSEIALTDGLALALGTFFTVDMKFFLLLHCIVYYCSVIHCTSHVFGIDPSRLSVLSAVLTQPPIPFHKTIRPQRKAENTANVSSGSYME
jgi:hypothetical protein